MPDTSLTQPCCSLSGAAAMLSAMEGRFAVVVHGERDCLNSFLAFNFPGAERFYCTNLGETQAALGRTSKALERCLEAAAAKDAPQALIVLGTCLTEMIGDDFPAVARRFSRRMGVPVLALRTSGLRSGTQAELLDLLYASLSTLSPRRGRGRSRKEGKGLILVGLPADGAVGGASEIERTLERLGLDLVGSFPHRGDLDAWRRIGGADAAFVVDRSLYPRFAAALESRGMSVAEVPLPIGLGQSLRCLEIIARRFGVEERLKDAAADGARECRREIARFRADFRGLSLAYGLRMCTNYEGDFLAYEGLGDLEFFAELGFRTALLVQGAPESESRRRIGERLRALGRKEPFLVFPDPIVLPGILSKGGFSLAYLGGHAGPEAARAGVPLVATRSLSPFFKGCLDNIARVRELLSGKG
ncbi:MAG: hypothetical protein HY748_02885 [Elusimicrobia bacterium]|nr:hypothetical protein [Elusimicrobiota bacterium]